MLSDEERGSIIAMKVWDWIEKKENEDVSNSRHEAYNQSSVDQFNGYKKCLADIKNFILAESAKLELY